jgi:predicted enzyme related to lactoylglutathione lyase
MTSRLDCVTFDCADPRRLATFWAAAMGYERAVDDEGWVVLRDPAGAGPNLGFQKVPEPKVVKNRVHPDLVPSDGMEAEVARLEGLGATAVRLVDEHADGPHTIMADPEGNEFCVVAP